MTTEDAEVFGEGVMVHCSAHGAPHETGWCTVPARKKTLLKATEYPEAVEECRERGLWLFSDLQKEGKK